MYFQVFELCFLKIFDIKADYDLRIMTENQTPNSVCAKILQALDKIFDAEKPDCILVPPAFQFVRPFRRDKPGIISGY